MEMTPKQVVDRLPGTPGFTLDTAIEVWVGYIRLVGRIVQSVSENHLQPFNEVPWSSGQLDQPVHIVWNIESIVPRTPFMEAGDRFEVLSLTGIERRQERSVFPERTQAAIFLRPVMAVAKGTLPVLCSILRMTQSVCQAGKGGISHIILQGVGDRIVSREILAEPTQGNVTLFDVRIYVRTHPVHLSRCFRGLDKGFVSCLDIEVLEPLQPGVSQYRDCRIPFHRECLPAVQFPFGHPSPLPVHIHYAPGHVDLLFRIDEGKKLVDIAAGIPQGEYGVTVMTLHHSPDARFTGW